MTAPKSDRTVLMAMPDGRVQYVRDRGDGKPEPVALRETILAHIKRKKRRREDDRDWA